MDWLKIVSDAYKAGYYKDADAAVYVVKNKITPQQYKDITGKEYAA